MTQALSEKDNTVMTGQEDDMRIYLQQIRSYPLLTAQQELQLAKECAAGNEEAIRTMVNSNLRLVVSVAKEYAGRGVPLLDLIQEGSIGLLAAARKFDYTRQCRFSTYATKWIKQGVNRCILNHAGLIRVPLHTQERMRKLLFAKTKYCQDFGREPQPEELARLCDLPEEKVRQLLQLLPPQISSLDAPVGDPDHDALQQLLEDTTAPCPHEDLVRKELKRTVDSLLSNLNERQQRVLRLHFGMEDGVCYSLEQIGKLLEVSKERARQINNQAITKLQTLGANLGLEEFLE